MGDHMLAHSFEEQQ